MKKFIIIVLAAVLMQSASSVACAQSTTSRPKPSSFVPHSHTKHHVYGAPIRPAIVGHSKVSHHKQALKNRSSTPKK
jgi:hypothetical protein